MDIWVLHQEGKIICHQAHPRHRPETFLKAIAVCRNAIVIAMAHACVAWYGLTSLSVAEGIPIFVLGHALSLQAIHGSKATKATGQHPPRVPSYCTEACSPRPPSSPTARAGNPVTCCTRVYPTRHKAELHVTSPPPTLCSPPSCPQPAEPAADGLAKQCPAPPRRAQRSVAVSLALLGYDHPRLSALQLPIVTAAKQHDADTLSLFQTVPGVRTILRLVLQLRDPRHTAFAPACPELPLLFPPRRVCPPRRRQAQRDHRG